MYLFTFSFSLSLLLKIIIIILGQNVQVLCPCSPTMFIQYVRPLYMMTHVLMLYLLGYKLWLALLCVVALFSVYASLHVHICFDFLVSLNSATVEYIMNTTSVSLEP